MHIGFLDKGQHKDKGHEIGLVWHTLDSVRDLAQEAGDSQPQR